MVAYNTGAISNGYGTAKFRTEFTDGGPYGEVSNGDSTIVSISGASAFVVASNTWSTNDAGSETLQNAQSLPKLRYAPDDCSHLKTITFGPVPNCRDTFGDALGGQDLKFFADGNGSASKPFVITKIKAS